LIVKSEKLAAEIPPNTWDPLAAQGMALVHPQNEGTAEEKLKTIWQKILDDKEEPGKILGSVDGYGWWRATHGS